MIFARKILSRFVGRGRHLTVAGKLYNVVSEVRRGDGRIGGQNSSRLLTYDF